MQKDQLYSWLLLGHVRHQQQIMFCHQSLANPVNDPIATSMISLVYQLAQGTVQMDTGLQCGL